MYQVSMVFYCMGSSGLFPSPFPFVKHLSCLKDFPVTNTASLSLLWFTHTILAVHCTRMVSMRYTSFHLPKFSNQQPDLALCPFSCHFAVCLFASTRPERCARLTPHRQHSGLPRRSMLKVPLLTYSFTVRLRNATTLKWGA